MPFSALQLRKGPEEVARVRRGDGGAEFAAADIEPAPDFCAGLGTSGILGLVKVGEAVKTLLNLDGILGSALAVTAKALRATSSNLA